MRFGPSGTVDWVIASLRLRYRALAAAAFLAALTATVTLAGAPPAIGGISTIQGSPGVGDPLFPKAGNGGYDVASYDAKLRYKLKQNKLVATTKIKAKVKTPGNELGRFDLDFRGPKITSLRVNRKKATYERQGQELIITPKKPLADKSRFEVKVSYAGQPQPVTDPDGSQEGWVVTKGYSVALGEPQGTPAWLPSNDHPTDKARFEITIDVPRGQKAISNGRLVRHKHHQRGKQGHKRKWSTFEYRQSKPMATYLATVATGPLVFDKAKVQGARYLAALSKEKARNGGVRQTRKRTAKSLAFGRKAFGKYPFSDTGGIVIPSSLGYSLETQTRPYYPIVPDQGLAVHELGHQWFGDSVSITGWNEIWLNEGFATYLEFLHEERNGGPTAKQTFDQLYAGHPADDDNFWNPPPGAPPTGADIFDNSIYVRGAMALEAVRLTVGDKDFFKALRKWATENRYGNGTITGFQSLVESISGEDLDTVFQNWLYDPGKPPPVPNRSSRAAVPSGASTAEFDFGSLRLTN